MVSWEEINSNLNAVMERFSKFSINKTWYDKNLRDPDVIAGLVGVGKKIEDWDDFKRKCSKYQEECGLIWQVTAGAGGPLKLKEVRIPENLGKELAEDLLKGGIEKGDLKDEVRKKVSGLAAFEKKSSVESDLEDFRDGFRKGRDGLRKYTFLQGPGFGFRRGLEVISFKGSEAELGGKVKNLIKEIV